MASDGWDWCWRRWPQYPSVPPAMFLHFHHRINPAHKHIERIGVVYGQVESEPDLGDTSTQLRVAISRLLPTTILPK
ncbi:MAG: hypothetical protein R3C44_07345 [Chloroflexota bacterium]